MIKVILLVFMFITINANSFVDKIPYDNLKEVLSRLDKNCTLYHTDIYSSCYSDFYGRVAYTVYVVDKKAYEVNIQARPSFYNDKMNKHNNKWYSKSGYDRGHLAWDAVFDYDFHILKQTYNLELNIVPMKPDINRHKWNYIENQVLKIIWTHGVEMVIVDILTPSDEYLKNTIINIPKELYKVVMYNNSMLCFKVDQFETEKNVEPYRIDCKELDSIK